MNGGRAYIIRVYPFECPPYTGEYSHYYVFSSGYTEVCTGCDEM